MIDTHYYPSHWGIIPVLFKIGSFKVEAYPFFVTLAIIVGGIVYFFDSRQKKESGEKSYYLILGGLIGGTLGAKLPIFFLYFNEILKNPLIFLSGRTITGGLIGGTLGVILTKKILKIKGRKGNLFAPAIAIGVAIGRLGCFSRGCCYGKPTSLFWGVNFGDGVMRHPTQLYESLFMFAMFLYLKFKKNPKPGELFKTLMLSYFTFRFFIEFIRVEKIAFFGLTWFQIISLVAIVYILIPKKFFKE